MYTHQLIRFDTVNLLLQVLTKDARGSYATSKVKTEISESGMLWVVERVTYQKP